MALVLQLLVSVSLGVLVARDAHADAPPRVDRMASELRNNEDFRVRTQAALALGASKDKRAVAPLCDGLDDSSTTVRAAAAAALGKLALGGTDCLKSHLSTETNASVKSVLVKALDSVKTGQRPVVNAETKYYVAVGPTTDKTGRSGTEVDDLIRKAVEDATADLPGFVLAPREETPAEAKELLGKWKKVKAFFLMPLVRAPDYSGGNLTVRIELTVFTYPGKAMKGTIGRKATQSDVRPGDKSSENDLITQLASSALSNFASSADRFAQ
ncbi:MAG TPA: HEAT repeat domain-containing protein [Polyangiaceae bacterium]|nr:HEAT repeat domain-containing protein [Polyangiaceae bacterium]